MPRVVCCSGCGRDTSHRSGLCEECRPSGRGREDDLGEPVIGGTRRRRKIKEDDLDSVDETVRQYLDEATGN